MASKRGIEAGKAYVTGFWDGGPLRRGLKSASASLRKFGGGLRRVGAGAIGIATSIVAPLAATSKLFSSMGDQIGKMAARTGFSVEALSQLQFAAEQSGASVESLEGALLKMNRRLGRITAGQGSGSEIKALDALGLTAEELEKMNPEQRFNAIADAMANMTDKSEAAGLAQRAFGTGVDKILPLLLQGSDGINKLRRQADELGITLSSTDVKAAEKFTDQLNILRRVVLAKLFSVGAAVAPMIGEFIDVVSGAVARFGEWIDRNRALIATLFAVGAGVGVAGVAVFGLGAAITALSIVLGVASAAIGAILSPVGLAVAGFGLLAGIAAYVAHQTGALGEAINWLREQFGPLAQRVAKVFGVIRDALAAGQWQAAVDALWAAMRVAWLEGIDWLLDRWQRWSDATINVFDQMIAGMRIGWQSFVGFFVEHLLKALSMVEGLLADVLGALGFDDAAEALRKASRTDRQAAGFARGQAEDRQSRIAAELTKRQQARAAERASDDAKRDREIADASADLADQLHETRTATENANSEITADVPDGDEGSGAPTGPRQIGPQAAKPAINTAVLVGQSSGMNALFQAISKRGRVTPGDQMIANEIASLKKDINKNHRELKKRGGDVTIKTPTI